MAYTKAKGNWWFFTSFLKKNRKWLHSIRWHCHVRQFQDELPFFGHRFVPCKPTALRNVSIFYLTLTGRLFMSLDSISGVADDIACIQMSRRYKSKTLCDIFFRISVCRRHLPYSVYTLYSYPIWSRSRDNCLQLDTKMLRYFAWLSWLTQPITH